MRSSMRWGLVGLFVALTGAAVLGHVRLATGGGSPLFWANESDVSIVVSSTGSVDIADESETAAVRLALEEWNAASGSAARLVENTSAVERARTDWDSTDVHLVLFDEDDSSGFFPNGSGVVAITPILFQSNGRIVDADVLFNGDWDFSTTGAPGSFDVQDVVTHELGHLLGLDHTGWAGATMYPYVDPNLTVHRSLSLDEVDGMRDAYPAQTFGRLSGKVRREGGASVAGAHVVARNAEGRTAGSSLSEEDGDFTLHGLPPGSYTVYAVPLDSPVSEDNLGDSLVIETDFEPAFYATSVVIAATENVALGNLVVDDDVAVSLGKSFDLLAVAVAAGESSGPFFLTGEGFVLGSTLEASDLDLTVDNVVFTPGTPFDTVSFSVTVPAGELPGHADLTVTTPGGDVSILPAALEITSPVPEVDLVDPSEGSSGGGTPVTIEGAGFRAGARVVIGDQVYVDGVDATVVDADTITLTTAPTVGGDHDVVVFDASGVEGRLGTAFHVGLIPAIQALFPSAGDSAGGTQVTVTGADFVTGLEVRIGGEVQLVDSVSATQVVFTTVASAAPVGVPQTLEIENPDGETASSQFTFQGQPDPVLVSLAPDRGSSKGGTLVTLSGMDFSSDSEVWFGVDPLSGAGGTQATMVTFVDATTLQVMTPAVSKGAAAVLVRDASSGQGSILPAGFTFTSSSGGGGGCTLRPIDGELGPPLAGAWWMVALLVLLAGRAVRAGRESVRAG